MEEYPCIADMTETRKKSPEVASNTVTVLLAKQAEHLVDGHRIKVVVVGSAPKGVAVAIAILFKVGEFSIFFLISNLSYHFDFLISFLRYEFLL